jgi:hypothetical protein
MSKNLKLFYKDYYSRTRILQESREIIIVGTGENDCDYVISNRISIALIP